MQVRTLSLGLSILFAGACNKAADAGDTGGTIDFGDMDDIEDGDDDNDDDDDDDDDGGSGTTDGGTTGSGTTDGGTTGDGATDGGTTGGTVGGGTDGGTMGGGTGGGTMGGGTGGGTMGGGTGTGGGTTGGGSATSGGTGGGSATSGGTGGGSTTGGETADGGAAGGGGSGADAEGPDLTEEDWVDSGDLAVDDDSDGFSEEEGDCNDTDASIYPGAAEDCDGIDSSCDGYLDLEYWDDYEPNDDLDMAYDLGDIDGWFLGTSSITMENLNFDYAGDEDWFLWRAVDTWYDDPNISMTITTDDVLNLYAQLYVYRSDSDSSELLVDKTLVGTSITITEDDFPVEESTGWWDAITDWATGLFDSSDDYFYLKISTAASAWDEDICRTGLYNLTIDS